MNRISITDIISQQVDDFGKLLLLARAKKLADETRVQFYNVNFQSTGKRRVSSPLPRGM